MIYDILRNICKYDKISISQAERDMGLSRGALSKLDSHKPSAERLEKIANYFKIPETVLTKRTAPAYMRMKEVLELAERTGIPAHELVGEFFNEDEINLNLLVHDFVRLKQKGIIDNKIEANEQTQTAVHLFKSLPEEKQRQVIDYMEYLKFKR